MPTKAKAPPKKTAKKTPAKAKAATPKKAGVSSGRKVAAKAKTKAKSGAKTATKAKPKAKARAKATPKQVAAAGRRRTTSPQTIYGVTPYKRRKNEAYMNDRQLEHFRTVLESWKRELMEEVDRTIHHLRDDAGNFPDANDRATQETEFGIELRTRDRERKLIRKIDAALSRITDGTYGYCEKTGEEIGLDRLEARPIATMSVEAQERYETVERHYGD
ncbi:MAG: RNA polymerase-binding protein DksA [Halieaceae bacterium]|nr:RNA polymerase-binding protein DksA [Halieaceae bacterium]